MSCTFPHHQMQIIFLRVCRILFFHAPCFIDRRIFVFPNVCSYEQSSHEDTCLQCALLIPSLLFSQDTLLQVGRWLKMACVLQNILTHIDNLPSRNAVTLHTPATKALSLPNLLLPSLPHLSEDSSLLAAEVKA